VSLPKTIEEVVEQLKRDPSHPVTASLGGLTVEVRALPNPREGESAADLFAAIGPWAGETTEEILALLEQARTQGGHRTA
jgi:hypothetical protein